MIVIAAADLSGSNPLTPGILLSTLTSVGATVDVSVLVSTGLLFMIVGPILWPSC